MTKEYRSMFLAPAEVELLELLRGDEDAGDFHLIVSRTGGHVAVNLKLPQDADAGQGEGATFSEAWERIAPYWA